MTAERIALISDWEGNVAALQAALRAIKRHAPDSIVVAGDILAPPFSPDPPSETIALLRSEPVQAIPGNTDRYLLDWGTPRWPHTLWMRLRRSDPAGSWLDDIAAGQALVAPPDLAWLRIVRPSRDPCALVHRPDFGRILRSIRLRHPLVKSLQLLRILGAVPSN